ncbi:MAG: hypothetical protein M1816_000555 [Peltula sp. TS41687]|nr:MAG: hypothetical protein M1816_000555 [Peltula sp. TS41687]
MRHPKTFLPLRQCLRVPERCHRFTFTHWNASHAFSTSARTYEVAPESPKYIHIPQPPQPTYPPKRIVKGILPVPREIFSSPGPDKTSREYFAAVTPEPRGSPNDPSQLTARTVWRRRLASSRRRLLRESLVELRWRKDRTDKAVAARKSTRRAERERALSQPQREDERLTSPSVTQAMKQLQIGVLPDPDREARIAAKAANVAAIQQRIREKRKDLLHTLYVNARAFITTESHLDDEIEKVFVQQPREWANDIGSGKSIWHRGPPESMQDLINVANGKEHLQMDRGKGPERLAEQRLRRIAEELTGGKL